jgi:ferritin-like metal-binding protein YciE
MTETLNQEIRDLYYQKGKSLKGISRITGHSYRTIRKVVEEEGTIRTRHQGAVLAKARRTLAQARDGMKTRAIQELSRMPREIMESAYEDAMMDGADLGTVCNCYEMSTLELCVVIVTGGKHDVGQSGNN